MRYRYANAIGIIRIFLLGEASIAVPAPSDSKAKVESKSCRKVQNFLPRRKLESNWKKQTNNLSSSCFPFQLIPRLKPDLPNCNAN